MSNRVQAVAAAIGQIVQAPSGRGELAALYSILCYYSAKLMVKLILKHRSRRASGNRMLTVKEAASLCGRSRSFIYERSEALGFGHRNNGCRGLRISEKELRRWMEG